MMKKQFKFSIIMSVYNVEPYIDEAVESVLKQTIGFENNVQIVFVNDGSKDKNIRRFIRIISSISNRKIKACLLQEMLGLKSLQASILIFLILMMFCQIMRLKRSIVFSFLGRQK